jgi:hypothetical protein
MAKKPETRRESLHVIDVTQDENQSRPGCNNPDFPYAAREKQSEQKVPDPEDNAGTSRHQPLVTFSTARGIKDPVTFGKPD